jgi:hypothetical protein
LDLGPDGHLLTSTPKRCALWNGLKLINPVIVPLHQPQIRDLLKRSRDNMLPLAGCLAVCIWLLPARGVEIKGITYFLRPPSDVDLVSYYTQAFDSQPDDYFTLQLPADAGASLGGLTIEQTRGADRQFTFAVERTRAFLGRPRAEGAQVPLEARFDPTRRRFSITFPQPVPPGSTLTVVLQPWNNPIQPDTYMYEVMAYPAGPNPTPASLGYGTLNIYPFQSR